MEHILSDEDYLFYDNHNCKSINNSIKTNDNIFYHEPLNNEIMDKIMEKITHVKTNRPSDFICCPNLKYLNDYSEGLECNYSLLKNLKTLIFLGNKLYSEKILNLPSIDILIFTLISVFDIYNFQNSSETTARKYMLDNLPLSLKKLIFCCESNNYYMGEDYFQCSKELPYLIKKYKIPWSCKVYIIDEFGELIEL